MEERPASDRIHETVGRIADWYSVAQLVAALMPIIIALVSAGFRPIAQHGWSAVVLFALFGSAAIIAMLGLGAIGWRYVFPIAPYPVAEITTETSKPKRSWKDLALVVVAIVGTILASGILGQTLTVPGARPPPALPLPDATKIWVATPPDDAVKKRQVIDSAIRILNGPLKDEAEQFPKAIYEVLNGFLLGDQIQKMEQINSLSKAWTTHISEINKIRDDNIVYDDMNEILNTKSLDISRQSLDFKNGIESLNVLVSLANQGSDGRTFQSRYPQGWPSISTLVENISAPIRAATSRAGSARDEMVNALGRRRIEISSGP